MSSWLTKYILNNADAEFEFTTSELSFLTFLCVRIDINTEETRNSDGWMELKYTTKKIMFLLKYTSRVRKVFIGNLKNISSLNQKI